MGGRGTFAAGIAVAYTYETVGFINGIKVLKGMQGTNAHSLPESSHSSNAYIKLYPDGTFHELRLYDDKHRLYMEIAYHTENQLGKGKVLHYHTYTPGFSETKNGPFDRSDAIKITQDMPIYKKYKDVFKGVKM